MFHSLKRFCLPLVLLIAGAQSSFGFAMLGPFEDWQVPTIGYNLPEDYGAPKNLGDGYRWNTPTVYYACDASFANFFGANGLAAIDQAFAVFNNLTNLSTYTTNLSEWPLTTTRFNYTAEALKLIDVKSVMMSRITQLLGLAEPKRYLWTLHDRYIPTPVPCPNGVFYVTVQRNFDPATYEYSSFVNGTLYDYYITEFCTGTPTAITTLFSVDPTITGETAVASGVDSILLAAATTGNNLVVTADAGFGRYYTGLTRDDVGGLRYLMATNRMNVESVGTNILQLSTNSTPQILVTSNLATFTAQALTNSPAALLLLYPNLIITSTNYSFTNFVTTNISVVLTHPVGPAGTIQATLVTNFTTNVQPLYSYSFANVYTNHAYAQGFVTTQTSSIGPKPFAPAGTLQTNVVSSFTLSPFTNGDFYILPTNLCGPYVILSTNLTNITFVTNTFPLSTNGITNVQNLTFDNITYFTNYTFIVEEVDCLTNSATLREGIDKINFVRRDFDSILGNFWTPITNTFQLTAITNGAPLNQTFRRVVNRPDILIYATDEIHGPADAAFNVVRIGSFNFNTNQVSADGAGPGTIEPQVTMFFGKGGGPIYLNDGGAFQSQAGAGLFYQWGSFDGSTNNPIVYPSGVSLSSLESQVFFQVTTTILPPYQASVNSAGNPYSAQLSASGGTPNGAGGYTWSLAPNSPSLPPGLALSSDGVISGIISGNVGTTFDFTVQATDAGSRSTQGMLSIAVTP